MGEGMRPHTLWLSALLATVLLPLAKSSSSSSQKPHSRQKRLLWLTSDGRLALPPGTAMSITTSVSMPFVRYPPEGFLSNISIALPFSISFDKLGLTDNQNPYGVLPPILGRSLGRSAGSLVADYLANFINHRRSRRSTTAEPPPTPPPQANFHGGERILLYSGLEDMLSNFGLDGKACLLRTMCEVHTLKIQRFGLIGEFFKLFLTASQSPYAHLIDEYVKAEETGARTGECWQYYKDCPKSLFIRNQENKYRKDEAFHEGEGLHEVTEENFVEENEVEVHAPHFE